MGGCGATSAPLEASLIVYTWPLWILIFTSASLKQKLKRRHMIGALLGFGGIAVLFAGKGMTLNDTLLLPGHGWALMCALTWSLFSAFSARHSNIGSGYLGWVFLFSSGISLSAWFVLGAPLAPPRSLVVTVCSAFLVVSGYGLWDFGIKHGNVQLLGISSFLTPVLAVLYLVMLQKAEFGVSSFAALVLIVLGIGVAIFATSGREL